VAGVRDLHERGAPQRARLHGDALQPPLPSELPRAVDGTRTNLRSRYYARPSPYAGTYSFFVPSPHTGIQDGVPDLPPTVALPIGAATHRSYNSYLYLLQTSFWREQRKRDEGQELSLSYERKEKQFCKKKEKRQEKKKMAFPFVRPLTWLHEGVWGSTIGWSIKLLHALCTPPSYMSHRGSTLHTSSHVRLFHGGEVGGSANRVTARAGLSSTVAMAVGASLRDGHFHLPKSTKVRWSASLGPSTFFPPGVGSALPFGPSSTSCE
jgi:hypothetical protein